MYLLGPGGLANKVEGLGTVVACIYFIHGP